MNWKKLLTNPFKKKLPDVSVPVLSPKDAVAALPSELIKQVRSYPSKNGHGAKLTEEMQLELMEFIARYSNQEEINAYFVGTHRVGISKELLHQYKHSKKWQPVIAKLREKYLLGTEEVAISHKRIRLDRAERASQIAMKKNDERAILQANQDAREEIVGKSTNIGSVNMQFNGMTYEDIQEYKRQILEKLNRKPIEIKSEVT